MNFLPEKVARLIPFAVPIALMGYAMIVMLGGAALRKRRLRKEASRRKADPRAPWDRWLDEINRKVNAEERPQPKEKWRE